MTSYLVPVLCFHMQVKQGFDVSNLDVHLSGITMLFTKQKKGISRLKKQATASIWSYSRSIYQLVAWFTYPSKISSFITCHKVDSQSESDKPVAYSAVNNGQYFTDEKFQAMLAVSTFSHRKQSSLRSRRRKG